MKKKDSFQLIKLVLVSYVVKVEQKRRMKDFCVCRTSDELIKPIVFLIYFPVICCVFSVCSVPFLVSAQNSESKLSLKCCTLCNNADIDSLLKMKDK